MRGSFCARSRQKTNQRGACPRSVHSSFSLYARASKSEVSEVKPNPIKLMDAVPFSNDRYIPSGQARLNLGILAQESQETVISAYLAGLLRRETSIGSPAAPHPRQLQSAGDTGAPCQEPGAWCADRPPQPSSRVCPPRPAVRPRTSPSPFPFHALSPPATRSAPVLAASASTPATAAAGDAAAAPAVRPGASNPRRPSMWSGRGLLQRRRRWGRRRLLLDSTPPPGVGNYTRDPSGDAPMAPPATAQSGNAIAAAMTARIELTGRAATAPGCSSTHPPPHGWHARDADGCWGWHGHAGLASSTGAGADADGFPFPSCGRRLYRRRRQQLAESSRRPDADGRGEAAAAAAEEEEEVEMGAGATLLVCRGWEKFASREAGGAAPPTAGNSPAASSATSPEDAWPRGFKGCGEGFLGPRCRRGEPESPRRNMFLTTRHRRGNAALAPPA